MLTESPTPSTISNTETPTAPPETPKRSLSELLVTAKQSDDGLLGFDIDLEELGVAIVDKVDGIIAYLDHCEECAKANDARAEVPAKRAAQLRDKAAAYRNKGERLEAYVAANMTGTETHVLPGTGFRIRREFSESVVEKAKADAKAMVKFKGWVRSKTAYAWDKAALKKALKAKDLKAMQVAEIKTSPWVTIEALTTEVSK